MMFHKKGKIKKNSLFSVYVSILQAFLVYIVIIMMIGIRYTMSRYFRQPGRSYFLLTHQLSMSDFMDSCSIVFERIQDEFDISHEDHDLQLLYFSNDARLEQQKKLYPTIGEIIGKDKKKKKQRTRGKLSRIISKSKSQKEAEYKKNICGYIIKKVLREFIYGSYKKYVQQVCEAEHADYQATQDFYDKRIEGITGPSHLKGLFYSENKCEIPSIRVFWKFCMWFLKERYARHLMGQGKMQAKQVYIEYKNRKLIPMLIEYEQKLMTEHENFSTLNIDAQNNEII